MGFLSALGLAPDQENLQAGIDADKANAKMIEDKWLMGELTDEEYFTAMSHFDASFKQFASDGAVKGTSFDNAIPAGDGAFVGKQIQDVVDEKSAAIQKLSTGMVIDFFKLVPWPVWIGLAVWIFWPAILRKLANR